MTITRGLCTATVCTAVGDGWLQWTLLAEELPAEHPMRILEVALGFALLCLACGTAVTLLIHLGELRRHRRGRDELESLLARQIAWSEVRAARAEVAPPPPPAVRTTRPARSGRALYPERATEYASEAS